jgi:hypothetical protein
MVTTRIITLAGLDLAKTPVAPSPGIKGETHIVTL